MSSKRREERQTFYSFVTRGRDFSGKGDKTKTTIWKTDREGGLFSRREKNQPARPETKLSAARQPKKGKRVGGGGGGGGKKKGDPGISREKESISLKWKGELALARGASIAKRRASDAYRKGKEKLNSVIVRKTFSTSEKKRMR